MKFYGNGAVWDKERNRILCRFLSGSLETADTRTIAILQKMGYRHDAEPEMEPVMEREPERAEAVPEPEVAPVPEPPKPKRYRGTPCKRRKVTK